MCHLLKEALLGFLLCNGSCYRCVKEGQKVRDFPNIASRGTEGKKVAPSASMDEGATKRPFYALQTIGGSQMMEMMIRVSPFNYIFSDMSSF